MGNCVDSPRSTRKKKTKNIGKLATPVKVEEEIDQMKRGESELSSRPLNAQNTAIMPAEDQSRYVISHIQKERPPVAPRPDQPVVVDPAVKARRLQQRVADLIKSGNLRYETIWP